MDTKQQIIERARISYDQSYQDRIWEIVVQQAGYPPERSLDRSFGRRSVGQNEPDSFEDLALNNPADGISNKLAQDAKINTMSLSMWKPELVFSSGDHNFKLVNKAWFDRLWWETEFGEKLLEMDSDMHLGLSIASVGLDEEGKANWERYPVLRAMWDPMYRRPAEWRWIFLIDDYEISDASNRFGVSIAELKPLSARHDRASLTSGNNFAPDVVRVYRYWSKPYFKNGKKVPGSCCVVIGSIANANNSIWLKWNEEYKWERMGKSEDAQAGKNPFDFLPVSGGYEVLIPHVNKPVGRAQWEVPLSRMMARIWESIMMEVEDGSGITFLSSMGLDSDTIDKFRNGGRLLDEKSLVMVADNIQDLREAFMRIPSLPISQDRLQLVNMLQQELNEAAGRLDAERGQKMGGEMTAYEFAGRQDAGGIQARHANGRKAVMITDIVTKLRAISADFDTREIEYELGDGLTINTKTMPINPMLKRNVRIGVTEDSISGMGRYQLRQLAIETFQRVDLPLIQLGVMDPSIAGANLVKEVYGTPDPQTRGVMSQEQIQAKKQQAQAEQTQMQAQQAMAEQLPQAMMQGGQQPAQQGSTMGG